jgi:DNA-binding transcriptional LysR family regulator
MCTVGPARFMGFLAGFDAANRGCEMTLVEGVPAPSVADAPICGGSTAEYRDFLADRLREHGLAVRVGFQSEREDRIQMMVAAGFGLCFLPEFSPTIPGVRTQPVDEPEVAREVSLVSMSGRRFSPVVLSFIGAIRAHSWSDGPAAGARAAN